MVEISSSAKLFKKKKKMNTLESIKETTIPEFILYSITALYPEQFNMVRRHENWKYTVSSFNNLASGLYLVPMQPGVAKHYKVWGWMGA